jgi:hypothetical protein
MKDVFAKAFIKMQSELPRVKKEAETWILDHDANRAEMAYDAWKEDGNGEY